MAAFVLNADTERGQTFRVFGHTVTERITARDLRGACYVWEELSPPGPGFLHTATAMKTKSRRSSTAPSRYSRTAKSRS